MCLDEEFNEFVHQTPLAQIQEGYIYFYANAASILDDDYKDFRYFLPRMLEVILCTEDHGDFFYDIIWRIIASTGHETWPTEEREALQQFAQAYLAKAERKGDPEQTGYARMDLEEAKLL
jgi:hypothetical protein